MRAHVWVQAPEWCKYTRWGLVTRGGHALYVGEAEESVSLVLYGGLLLGGLEFFF